MSGYGSDRQALIELAELAYYFDQIGGATVDLDGWPHPREYRIDAHLLEEWVTALRKRLETAGGWSLNHAREQVRAVYLGNYNSGGC